MKQLDIVKAYNATESLATLNFSKEDQWKIYCFRKELRPRIEFQKEQEKIIIDKYKEYIDSEGSLHGDKYLEYLKDIEELNTLEVNDLSIEKIELPLIDGVNFKTVELLEDFIEFKH